jgi:hypothetical protein
VTCVSKYSFAAAVLWRISYVSSCRPQYLVAFRCQRMMPCAAHARMFRTLDVSPHAATKKSPGAEKSVAAGCGGDLKGIMQSYVQRY